MFCSRCGKEIDNKSEQCPYCNALIENNVSAQNNANGKSGLISLILGSIGLLMAWVVALFGYALGGVGLAFGIKALKKEKEAENARLIAQVHFDNWARAVKKQFENKK